MSRLHRPKAGFWIRLCVLLIYPFDALLFRIRWHHLDRIPPPTDGGVIIAINHVSHIDTVLMARLIWQAGRIPRFMVKAGLFNQPILGAVVRGAGQIPVHRGTAEAASSLQRAAAVLAAGEAVVIYPEGTITHDPEQWPMQAKTGIARLWLLSPHTPVIPIGQWGAQVRTGARRRQPFRRRTAEASVGQPVDLDRFRGAEADAATLREITNTIMSAVRDEVARLRGPTPPTDFGTAHVARVDEC